MRAHMKPARKEEKKIKQSTRHFKANKRKMSIASIAGKGSPSFPLFSFYPAT